VDAAPPFVPYEKERYGHHEGALEGIPDDCTDLALKNDIALVRHNIDVLAVVRPDLKSMIEEHEAAREIEFESSATDAIFHYGQFSRLCLQILHDYSSSKSLSENAILALSTGVESMLCELFSGAAALATFAGRDTVTPDDLRMVRFLRGERALPPSPPPSEAASIPAPAAGLDSAIPAIPPAAPLGPADPSIP
jgi:histone H3/H4